ncbi:MAG: SDR family NAD(P)-dependent oxidoreductase [Devosia sp.]
MSLTHTIDEGPRADVPQGAIVTGGAGALGFAIAERLKAAGRNVVLFDVGDDVTARGEALGGLGLSCDMADEAAVNRAFSDAVSAVGPVGTVVHCAGIAPVTPFLDTDKATFDKVMAVNLTGGFVLFQQAARLLVEGGFAGRFLSITSISGERAGYGRAAYGTSKAALIQLTRQMALELGPYQITANAIAPGPVDTPLARGAHTAETRADYIRSIPVGRYGEEGEVADAAAFLTGDGAGYISGQTLCVDGGYMASGMGVVMAQSAAAVRRGPVQRKDDV